MDHKINSLMKIISPLIVQMEPKTTLIKIHKILNKLQGKLKME